MLNAPMICRFGGFRDVSSAYTTDGEMQRVVILWTTFVMTLTPLIVGCSYYSINNMKKL
jgi:hypothetical protein